jgi:hypothetical protein
MSHSEAGTRMASAVAGGLGIDAVGRDTPLLRETRAPAIVVVMPRLDAAVGASAARSIEGWMSRSDPEG